MKQTAVILVVISVLLNLAGYALFFYDKYRYFDVFVHFFTSFTFVYAIRYIHPSWKISTKLIVIVGIFLGVMWEATESVYGAVSTSYDFEGWTDTVTDIVANTIGNGGAAFIHYMTGKKSG